MRFNFVGKIEANDLSSKVPYYKKIDGYDAHAINLTCVAANNNRAFLEATGFKNNTFNIFDSEGKQIEVAWEDRFREDIVKKSRMKNIISFLDGTREEFIQVYDLVSFVNENIDKIKGKRFVITGAVKKNVYKDKVLDRFQIQNMYEIEEGDQRKNQLRVNGDFYFNKDSIDTADWKKEKKIYFNGYTLESWDKEHKNLYVSKQVIFDCHKADLENENHLERINFQLKQIGLAIDDNQAIVSKLKKGKYYKIGINLSYMNGSQAIEFDESQLTDNQRQLIALGLATLDELKPKGNIYGDRITSFFYKSFDLRGDYADGMVLVDDSNFEDNIFIPMVSEESFANAMNKPEESAPQKEDDDNIEDLFGDD